MLDLKVERFGRMVVYLKKSTKSSNAEHKRILTTVNFFFNNIEDVAYTWFIKSEIYRAEANIVEYL